MNLMLWLAWSLLLAGSASPGLTSEARGTSPEPGSPPVPGPPSEMAGPRQDLPIVITAVGDTMLASHVEYYVARHGPGYPWGDLGGLLTGDLVLANLE